MAGGDGRKEGEEGEEGRKARQMEDSSGGLDCQQISDERHSHADLPPLTNNVIASLFAKNTPTSSIAERS